MRQAFGPDQTIPVEVRGDGATSLDPSKESLASPGLHTGRQTAELDAGTGGTTDASAHLNQRICDVVNARPAAEAFLEENGIDYWFGWDRNLRSACEAASVDAEELASHLDQFPRTSPIAHAATAALPWLQTMLQESDRHATAEILPGLAHAEQALAALQPVQRKRVSVLLTMIRSAIQTHEQTAGELIAAATSIDEVTSDAIADPALIRRLRLDHLELAELSKELGAEARYLSTSPEAQEVITAARQVISALHHHIKMSYNFILPRFTSAVQHRPVQSEPW